MVNEKLGQDFDEVAIGHELPDVVEAAVAVLVSALARMSNSPEQLIERLGKVHIGMVAAVRLADKDTPFPTNRKMH